MTGVITATYENDVFKPERDLGLTPGTKVRLLVAPWEEGRNAEQDAFAEWERLCDESPIASTEPHLTRDQLHERR